jgi:hypothetical protein
MSQSPRPLFREHALKEYMQRREKDVLPRSVAPPTMLFVWLLLLITLTLLFLTWETRVPTFISGSGLLLFPTSSTNTQTSEMVLAFLPPASLPKLHPGLLVQIQFGSSTQHIQRSITHVLPTIQSPQSIRQKYALDASSGALITQPEAVAEIQLSNLDTRYADSQVTIQVQVGQQKVLSLIPGFDRLIGD